MASPLTSSGRLIPSVRRCSVFHPRSPIEINSEAIIVAAIRASNDAQRRAESGEGDELLIDRALNPIHELLRGDATGTVANMVISRIDRMTRVAQVASQPGFKRGIHP